SPPTGPGDDRPERPLRGWRHPAPQRQARGRVTDSDLVLTVPLARESAIEVGATSTALEAEDLEIAHVVWCATGHDEGDHSASWPVATYWPAWYARGIGTDRRPVTPVGSAGGVA